MAYEFGNKLFRETSLFSLVLSSGCDIIFGLHIADIFGLWRSLVAHLTGGQGVAGSNPVNPTS